MIILKQYNDCDYSIIQDFFSKKEIDKYMNRGIYRILSLFANISHTFISYGIIMRLSVVELRDGNGVGSSVVLVGGCMQFGYIPIIEDRVKV